MPARVVVSNRAIRARLRAVWRARTPQQEQAGREWYPAARDECARMADVRGAPLPNLIWTVAALSPNVGWDQNIRMAWTLARARTFRNPGTFHRAARDAWACLNGDRSRNTGPKREAFARAIAGDLEAVVIDRWMMAVVGHPKLGMSRQQFEHYAAAIAAFAREHGIVPRDMQAILWTVKREAA